MYPFLPYPGIPILLHTLSVLLPFSFFPNNNGTISLKLMMPSNSWQLRITILMLLSPPSTSPPRYCYLNRLPSTMDKHSSLIITFINTTYVTSLAHQSSNRDFRQLFSTFNGDAFYPLSVWPQDFKLIFWKKPISDKDTFKLFLFLGVGNGCSPNLISRWILTSQHWTSDKKADDNWTFYSTTRTTNHTFGFILTYTTNSGSTLMAKKEQLTTDHLNTLSIEFFEITGYIPYNNFIVQIVILYIYFTH